MLNSLAQFARKLEKYTGEKVEVKDEEEIELENSEAEDATDSKEELENSEAEDATDSKEELENSDPKSSIPDENEQQNNDNEQKQICKLNKKIEALEEGLEAIKTLLQIESAKDKEDDENELKSTPEDSKLEEGNDDEDFFENKELRKSKSKNKTHAVKEDDDEDFFENKELRKSKSKNKTHAVKCESKKVKKCGTLSYAKGYAYGKGFELLGNLKRGFTVNEPTKVKGKAIDLDVDIEGLPSGEWTIVKSKEGTYGIIKSKDIA
jgi:hypothetical protein